MQLLAISGSLRTGSLNTAALKAAALVAPGHVEIALYDGLGGLPAFNPDLRGREPQPVLDLRSRLHKADGVLIASPQYAHGIPGALKNALDWLADSNDLVGKPIAVLVTSPCYGWTHTLLIESLLNLSANVVGEASILLPLIGPTDERSINGNSKILAALHAAVARLADAVREQQLRVTNKALDPKVLVGNRRVTDLD